VDHSAQTDVAMLVNMRNGFHAGEWTVCPSRNLLSRGEDEVRVEPRVMDVLVCLAEQADQVISKDDLMARVWPDRHVTDDVLTVTIYALRKALGDEARRPRYVETVSRRGYRWIAPVTPINGAAATNGADATTGAAANGSSNGGAPADVLTETRGTQTETSAPASTLARTHTRGWRIGIAAAAIALVALAGAGVWLTGSRTRHIPSAESHEAYVKGRYFLDQRSPTGWQQAREQFERAVSLDPRDPAAIAGLADAYSAMMDFGVTTRDELRPKAMKAAQQAIALDAQSAEGHEALGRALFLFDWDFAGAERSLTRALALDPDYMPTHQAMAWVASARGKHDIAVQAARRALQLDPVNTARYTELAWIYLLGGERDEAARVTDRALQVNPRAYEALFMKGLTRELAGQPDEAISIYLDALRLIGLPDASLQELREVYRTEGLSGYYRRWVERSGAARGSSGNGAQFPMSETYRAQLLVRVGQTDRAIEALEHAYQKHEGALAWINVDPSFGSLRSDPRFQKIAARIPPTK
jgi:DNA-binding winged helix-turn-helix (wHTH) protein/tetratricopeptide (TPR) repeat protein